MKCYYAHCQSIYNTPQEKRDIGLLELLGFEVINPNTPKCQEECTNSTIWESPMDYFINLCAGCDVLAFRACQDGNIGAGVFTEISNFFGPIIEFPSRLSQRGLTVEQTREYLKEVGQR